MTTTATYPTPSEIRAAIERSCKRNLGAIPVVAYLTHRMTWNGEGMDIVATAVVVWTDRGDEHPHGWHSGVSVRSSVKHGLTVGFGGGHYDYSDLAEAEGVAVAYARGHGVRTSWR
jgi:hypothetical protein